MCPLQLFIKQTHHLQTPFSTPRSSCRGSSNWNGARGTPIPCPGPEQLPPAETAGARWVHEMDSPLAAPRKINLNLRQPICATPICTKLSPLCTWGQSSGSAIAHRSLRSLGHWVKFAAAIWFCIIPWSRVHGELWSEIPAQDVTARRRCPAAWLLFQDWLAQIRDKGC